MSEGIYIYVLDTTEIDIFNEMTDAKAIRRFERECPRHGKAALYSVRTDGSCFSELANSNDGEVEVLT